MKTLSAQLSIATAALLVRAATLKNITVSVPEGTSNHGDPRLLCTPTRWTDVIVFFLGNYVAHAGTVIVLPGEGIKSAAIIAAVSLLFPIAGVQRGIKAIESWANFAMTDLEIAARAGALCMVVRKEYPNWIPQKDDAMSNAILKISVRSYKALLAKSGNSLHPVACEDESGLTFDRLGL